MLEVKSVASGGTHSEFWGLFVIQKSTAFLKRLPLKNDASCQTHPALSFRKIGTRRGLGGTRPSHGTVKSAYQDPATSDMTRNPSIKYLEFIECVFPPVAMFLGKI